MLFNRVLILPITDGEYYEDEAERLPSSGVVVDAPDDAPVRPGETVWFSYTSEKWNEFYLCEYEDLFIVDRGGLKPLGDWRIVKWKERERRGLYYDYDDLKTNEGYIDGKLCYFPKAGRKLCVDHDHEQEWYWIINKNVPYLQI